MYVRIPLCSPIRFYPFLKILILHLNPKQSFSPKKKNPNFSTLNCLIQMDCERNANGTFYGCFVRTRPFSFEQISLALNFLHIKLHQTLVFFPPFSTSKPHNHKQPNTHPININFDTKSPSFCI